MSIVATVSAKIDMGDFWSESDTHDIDDDEKSDRAVEPECNCRSCRAWWHRLDTSSRQGARRAEGRLPERRQAIVRTVCPRPPAHHDLHDPDAALRQSSLSCDDGEGEKEQPRGALKRDRRSPSALGPGQGSSIVLLDNTLLDNIGAETICVDSDERNLLPSVCAAPALDTCCITHRTPAQDPPALVFPGPLDLEQAIRRRAIVTRPIVRLL
jgi:hypothetical protein